MKELLIASVVLSCVNLIGNIYDLHQKAGALELSIFDYLRYIRKLHDKEEPFVMKTNRRKMTHEATSGLQNTINSIEMCKNIDEGLDNTKIRLNDNETAQLLEGEKEIQLVNHSNQREGKSTYISKEKLLQNLADQKGGKVTYVSLKLWKSRDKDGATVGKASKSKKVTAFLAYVEVDDKSEDKSNTIYKAYKVMPEEGEESMKENHEEEGSRRGFILE